MRTERVTPLWDGRTARLKLKDLEKEDAGVYTCVAENELGRTRCSAELVVLDVTDPSDADLRPPVFVSGLPELTPATEGQPFELQVKLLGKSSCRFFYFLRILFLFYWHCQPTA